MQQLTTGQTRYYDYYSPTGARVLHIRVDRHHDHTAVTVVSPWDTTLDRAFPAQAEADAYLDFLRTEVEAGSQVWLIEERAGVLTSASAALDHFEQDLIDGINASMDTVQDRHHTAHERARNIRDEVQASQAQTGDRYGMRKQAPANARTVQPRPTMAGAHLTPETPAQIEAARQHRDGVVYPGNGITRPTLNALARKGYGTVRYAGARKQIVALDLNGRGLALGEQKEMAA